MRMHAGAWACSMQPFDMHAPLRSAPCNHKATCMHPQTTPHTRPSTYHYHNQARSGSAASMTAQVQAWGAVVLESSTPFAADSLLDLWARGSGVMSVSLYFEDSVGRRISRLVVANEG